VDEDEEIRKREKDRLRLLSEANLQWARHITQHSAKSEALDRELLSVLDDEPPLKIDPTEPSPASEQ